MCPQRYTPATRSSKRNIAQHPRPAPHQCPRTRLPKQRTIGDFFPLHPTAPPIPVPHQEPESVLPPATPVTQDTNTNRTPPATPLAARPNTASQSSTTQQPSICPLSHQQPLTGPSSNDPWGDMWAIPLLATTFRIVSKNTGTINPQNLDMQAITNELIHLNASVFAAQETNIHWDPLTKYQIYQQCKGMAAQVRLTTATSQEPAADWYKPGGTLLLSLNQWTSRVISQGSDALLGRWAYQEFLGRNDQRIIVISGYRVCNQPFDAASNTVSAQQIRLMQANGLPAPNPHKLFLSDLITQIKSWRQANKEVILCIDANEPIDDPRSEVSRLFTETDLVDLHHHRYPALRKPATHQRGSHAIDLIAGSPLVVSALLHAWIHPFGDPVCIKGDHRLLGVDLDPEVLFGNAIPSLTKPQLRGTNSRHPQKVTKFCKRVVDQCNHHRLAERIADLQTLRTLDASHFDELEDIDACLTKILIRADRACTPMNATPWSPKLNQAYLRHRLWSIALTAHRTK